jgi:hypothetical protein
MTCLSSYTVQFPNVVLEQFDDKVAAHLLSTPRAGALPSFPTKTEYPFEQTAIVEGNGATSCHRQSRRVGSSRKLLGANGAAGNGLSVMGACDWSGLLRSGHHDIPQSGCAQTS